MSDTTLPPLPPLEYAQLRAEGLRLIEQLTGHRWTDYNLHDPGITLLEQLCFAITDLGYRINFPMSDLLASKNGALADLYPGEQVLPSRPVTLRDLRKLLLHLSGIRDARIQPAAAFTPPLYYDEVDHSLSVEKYQGEAVVPRGLFQVALTLKDGEDPDKVGKAALDLLHSNRNLCEDVSELTILDFTEIHIEAVVEIGAVEYPEALLAAVYERVDNYVSPMLTFHSLSEMLAKGKSMEEIFDGPLLERGFIDDDELDTLQLRHSLRISDLIRLMMELEGVTAIVSMNLSKKNKREEGGSSEQFDWRLPIDPEAPPVLARMSELPDQASLFHGKGLLDITGIRLQKNGIPVTVNIGEVHRLLSLRQKEKALAPVTKGTPVVAPGRDRAIRLHTALREQIPDVFGVGATGLSANAPAHRKAQARQLRTYLAFYDQLLANDFAQLDGVKELFSFQKKEGQAPISTYFSQDLLPGGASGSDLAALEEDALVKSSDEHRRRLARIVEDADDMSGNGDILAALDRKNRFLNHLLARFAVSKEDFVPTSAEHLAAQKRQRIEDKQQFLRDYPMLSSARGGGFNYRQPQTALRSDGAHNVAGLKLRICRLLGFPVVIPRLEDNPDITDPLHGLAEDAPGSFHLLEHILLRPMDDDAFQQTKLLELLPFDEKSDLPPLKDPYSLQVSFVFPNWLTRLQDAGFKPFLLQTLRRETPAHLRLYVHWLDQIQMKEFEEAHTRWLIALQNS